ncbi:hypothetical protein [Catellatospora sp. NPDC049609]|uniref:hypothetical protein n=1 Tax=Catellatospora sp. NPDC049609 TaxID=3155505 RepID=UPI00343BA65B
MTHGTSSTGHTAATTFSVDYLPDQARTALAEAHALAEAGSWQGALQQCHRALDVWWRLADGGRSAYLFEIIGVVDQYTKRLLAEQRWTDALHFSELSLQSWRRLVDDGGTVYRPLLAEALTAHALALQMTGNLAEATRLAEHSAEMWPELVAGDPTMRLGLGATLSTLVVLLANADRWEEALERSTESVALWQAVADESPDLLANLARALRQHAVVLDANGEVAAAVDAVDQALAASQRMDEDERRESLRDMARLASGLLRSSLERSGPEGGVRPSWLCVRIHEALAAEDPLHLPGLVAAMAQHTMILARAGRDEEAIAFHEWALHRRNEFRHRR